jgi:hypothetical protein
MYKLSIELSPVSREFLDDGDALPDLLASVADAITRLSGPDALSSPVTTDDGEPSGSWKLSPVICLYPSCGTQAVRIVDEQPLCGMHAMEFEEFIRPYRTL